MWEFIRKHSDLLIHFFNQFITHNRWPSAVSLIMNNGSSIIELPKLFSHFSIIDKFVSENFCKLAMNFSRLHVPYIQKSYYRTHFTVHRIRNCFKHLECILTNVNTTQFCCNCISCSTMNQED